MTANSSSPPSATLEPKHTREYHQALLEVWHTGDVGFLPHKYRRCGFSGAGNCCCGRDDRSRLHTATNAPTEQSS